jgi:hypothetical protein
LHRSFAAFFDSQHRTTHPETIRDGYDWNRFRDCHRILSMRGRVPRLPGFVNGPARSDGTFSALQYIDCTSVHGRTFLAVSLRFRTL